jgi:hypothetical protein
VVIGWLTLHVKYVTVSSSGGRRTAASVGRRGREATDTGSIQLHCALHRSFARVAAPPEFEQCALLSTLRTATFRQGRHVQAAMARWAVDLPDRALGTTPTNRALDHQVCTTTGTHERRIRDGERSSNLLRLVGGKRDRCFSHRRRSYSSLAPGRAQARLPTVREDVAWPSERQQRTASLHRHLTSNGVRLAGTFSGSWGGRQSRCPAVGWLHSKQPALRHGPHSP